MAKFSKKHLIEEVKTEGRVLGLHAGAVEIIAEKVADKISAWVDDRTEFTKEELNLRVAKELEKYNHDLAYIYKNRGKII